MDINLENIQTVQELKDHIKSLDELKLGLDAESKDILKNSNKIIHNQTQLIKNINLNKLCHRIQYITDENSKNCEIKEISTKFNQIFVAEKNIKNTIKFIDDLTDLKLCSESLEQCIATEDYEQASSLIYRFMKIDKRTLQELYPLDRRRLIFLFMIETELTSCIGRLNEIKIQIQKILENKCEMCLDQRDNKNVERYFKLLSMVGSHQKGLSLFSRYLTSIINFEFEDSKITLIVSDEELRPVVYIGRLLQIISANIVKYQPMVDTYYGPGEVIYIAREIQSNCIPLLRTLLNQFYQENKITEKNSLEDLVTKTTEQKRENLLHNIADHQHLLEIRDEVLDIYSKLEKFFLKVSCYKAFKMHTIHEHNLTSSIVDDVFYVVKKCFQRSLATLTQSAIELVLVSADRFFISDYMKIITRNVDVTVNREQIYNFINDCTYLSTQNGRLLKLIIISINDLETSSDNLTKLIQKIKIESTNKNISIDVSKCFKNYDRFIKLCLDFRTRAYNNIIYNGFSPLLKNIIQHMRDEDLVLKETIDYQTHQLSSIQNLVDFINNALSTLKKKLFENNVEEIIPKLIKEIVQILDFELKHCGINQYGGLCLNYQIRLIINCFSNNSKYFVRQHFNKLTKIGELLSAHD
ncbi:hypothetical protein HZS_989, partial [Henneguya salminicola]